ncbi:DUF4214 domain-containing protein, partial [Lamprobacter sp.]|uniref:DUF4214 domain-containing protein n=1 Tax=Lamprobacter sp. TaxID=3100796 RepID=UPI002B257875
MALFGGHGVGFTALDSAEFWSPGAAAFSLQSMLYTHDYSAFAQLADGRYLLAGGAADLGVAPGHGNAELFNPATGTFTATGQLNYPRMNASAATLASGRVLVAGGWYSIKNAQFAEVFDPATGAFTVTQPLNTPRAVPVVLPAADGSALVLGGLEPFGSYAIEQVERYDSASNTFSVVRSSLFAGETGWHISASNYTLPQRLPDGRYLLLARRAVGSDTEYTLFTVDPATKAIVRLSSLPPLPDSSWGALYPPVVDAARGVVYLIGTSLVEDGAQTRVSLLVMDPADGTLSWPDTSWRLSAGIYLSGMAASLLPDGRLFLSGGHSETGGQTNFSALAWTLLAEIDAGSGGGTGPEDPPDGECSYTLSALKLSAGSAASNGALTVTASGPDCSWSASSAQSWLQLNGAGGTGSATLGYTVAANTTGQPRMGVLQVAGQSVVVLQAAEQAEARTDGTQGNDVLSLPAALEGDGSAHIDGHGGTDTLLLPAFPNHFTVEQGASGQYTLRFGEATVTLANVEQLRFGASTPTTVALSSLASGAVQQQVALLTDLYLAFFGRAPDVAGLEYWQQQLLQGGRSLTDLARDFAWSAEAQALYPATGSNRDFVRSVYINVFDREPEPGGWDYWTDRLNGLGQTDVSQRGEFVATVVLNARGNDSALLGNRHDVALSYANRLSLQPGKGFDAGINTLLSSVDDSTASVAGAQAVLDYVFDTTRSLSDIINESELLDRLWQPVTPLDWEADARWLNATVTLPDPSPLLMSEVEVSVLFEDYRPNAAGSLQLPVPDAPFASAFVMLLMPGTQDYVVYLLATVLENQTSVEFSPEATAVDIILNHIDPQYLRGGLTPAHMRETIRDHGRAFIDEFVAALRVDPFYLRPDNLSVVYGGAFTAAVQASQDALRRQLDGGSVVFSAADFAGTTRATQSEGLTVLPAAEQSDFKVLPGREGTVFATGVMNGKLLIQSDSMLPARYELRDGMTNRILHAPSLTTWAADNIGPQQGLLYAYNASATEIENTHFMPTRLSIFTPAVDPFFTFDDPEQRSLYRLLQPVLLDRLLTDHLIAVMNSLLPMGDEAFLEAWVRWIIDQGWFRAAADHLSADPPSLRGAINSFVGGMQNVDNIAAMIKFAEHRLGHQLAEQGVYRIAKQKAQWLWASYNWRTKVMIAGTDILRTEADLLSTPPLIEFDSVSFPLHLERFTPAGLSKVARPEDERRVTLYGTGLDGFSAGGGSYHPSVMLQARSAAGGLRTWTIDAADVHSGSGGAIWFDLPFDWMDAGSDVVGPIHFQLVHAFVDPYNGNVVTDVRVPPQIGDDAYRIELGTEVVISGLSADRVTRGQELIVYGSGFAQLRGDNTV